MVWSSPTQRAGGMPAIQKTPLTNTAFRGPQLYTMEEGAADRAQQMPSCMAQQHAAGGNGSSHGQTRGGCPSLMGQHHRQHQQDHRGPACSVFDKDEIVSPRFHPHLASTPSITMEVHTLPTLWFRSLQTALKAQPSTAKAYVNR